MKTRKQKAMQKLKNSIRVVGKTPPNIKKGPTGELELFKKIARERILEDIVIQGVGDWIMAKHLYPNGTVGEKPIHIDQLAVINFSHIKPKGMHPELRLDPDNIEIVSKAYHEWQHTKQIPQTNYLN